MPLTLELCIVIGLLVLVGTPLATFVALVLIAAYRERAQRETRDAK